MIFDLSITQNTALYSIKSNDGEGALAISIPKKLTIILNENYRARDLLIMSNLFKYKSKKQQKRELIIFITPQLVE